MCSLHNAADANFLLQCLQVETSGVVVLASCRALLCLVKRNALRVTLVTGVLSSLAWSWKTRRVNLVKRIFWLELIENLGKYEELRLVLIIRVLYFLKPLKNVENLWAHLGGALSAGAQLPFLC